MLDIMQIIFKIKSIKQIELLPFLFFFIFLIQNDFLDKKVKKHNLNLKKVNNNFKRGFQPKPKFNRVIF
jgi:hypothetical protein